METTTATTSILTEEIQEKQLQIEHLELKPARIVTWETNFNHKLGCKAFIHVDLAPSNANISMINKNHVQVTEDFILRKQVVDKLIEIRTADKSHPAVKAYVKDMLLIPYQRISDMIAWSSHGMNDMDLANYFFNKYHPDFSWTTEMAVYFYLSSLY
jgi:hypothetical protein